MKAWDGVGWTRVSKSLSLKKGARGLAELPSWAATSSAIGQQSAREVKRLREWMAAWMAAAALGIFQAGCPGVRCRGVR